MSEVRPFTQLRRTGSDLRTPVAAVFVLLLSSLVVGDFASCQMQELPYDEGCIIESVKIAAEGPLPAGWSEHPPFFVYWYRGVGELFGRSTYTYRFGATIATLAAAFTLAMAGRRYPTFVVFGLAAFLTPIGLMDSTRPSASCLLNLACIAGWMSGVALLERWSLSNAAVFLVATLVSTRVHLLGFPFAISAGLILAVESLRCEHRARILSVALAAMTFAIWSILCDDTLGTRIMCMTGHYWGQSTCTVLGIVPVPLASIWFYASEIGRFDPRSNAWMQLALIGTAIVFAFTSDHRQVRFFALNLLVVTAVVIIAGNEIGDRPLVGRLFGPYIVLAYLFLGAAAEYSIRPRKVLILVALATLSIIPSCIAIGASALLVDPSTLILKELEGASGRGDVIVFGGSRCYYTFCTHMNDAVRNHSRIYLREGASPDNYTGRVLISKKLLIDAAELDELKQPFIFVQFEAAQAVQLVPRPDATTEVLGTWEHPATAVGEILLIKVTPNTIRQNRD